MKERSDIAVVGLGVMGSGIARNLESKGYTVSVYNRSEDKCAAFFERFGEGNFRRADSLEELCGQLETPRKVLLMVKAGEAVDETLQQLAPYLEPGDVVIDGGNSYYKDTQRRMQSMEEQGFLYVGCGISGGEEGALKGPSLMPGGSEGAKDLLMPVFLDICARTEIGEACCSWMGSGGAGHFVKMIHNGIEYGEMQLLCETYEMMHRYLGMDTAMCGRTFSRWAKQTPGFLLETAEKVLLKPDEDGTPLVEKILDAAGQKGTGAWTVDAAMALGVPVPVISEAVNARSLSARKELRTVLSEKYGRPGYTGQVMPAEVRFEKLQMLQTALLQARILCYAQGFEVLQAASDVYGWNWNLGEISQVWRAGCIIRNSLLSDIKQSYVYDRNLTQLLDANLIHSMLPEGNGALTAACIAAAENGIAVPAFSAALQYFNGYTSLYLPANLLQGMRDLFGAHTYERTDAAKGESFHTEW